MKVFQVLQIYLIQVEPSTFAKVDGLLEQTSIDMKLLKDVLKRYHLKGKIDLS